MSIEAIGELRPFAVKQDELLGKRSDYFGQFVTGYLDQLAKLGRVEVGWRACCGTTHVTMHTYRAWLKVVKKLRAAGVEIAEESVKHKNAYATLNGGFWNSIIYTIKP